MMPELPALARGEAQPCDIVNGAGLCRAAGSVMSRAMNRLTKCVLIALTMASPLAMPGEAAMAQAVSQRSWPEEKCARYTQVWREVTDKLGLRSIGELFRARHEAFLASGCQSAPDVCPRSRDELELANVLVLRGMSVKLASTFFPFRCGG
jgi:hypothetical protein